jgi:alpha/beta superfamily hydrolase
MDNNIIVNLARISTHRGFTSLRFNYRGVENSESHETDIAQKYQYWEESLHRRDYTDAVIDAQAALNFLTSQVNRDKIFIAGYSFGAVVGMKVSKENNHVGAFASISTPFGQYNLDFLQRCKKAKLFLYSENDFAATTEETLKSFSKVSPPKILELVQNTDHFYRRHEEHVAQKVCNFFHDLNFLNVQFK